MYTISQNLLIKTLAYICQGVLSLEVSRYCGYNFDNYRSLSGVFMNSDIFLSNDQLARNVFLYI